MKTSLTLLCLALLTPALMALTLDPDGDPVVPLRKPTLITETPVDDSTLRGLIFDVIDNIWLDIHTTEDFLARTKGIARKGSVTPERMTGMLEGIVREGLSDLEKAKKDSAESSLAKKNVIGSVQMMTIFHGPDTVALLKECARSEKGGRTSAMRTYINIVGAVDALPFLGEVLVGEFAAKKGKDLNPYRSSIFDSLHDDAKKLASENKDDDALKVYIFLMGMAILEHEPNAAAQLDHILCSALPDYATSIQREQAIGKIADLPLNSDHFKKIKTEISKVPANKRRDYNKQPLRVVKESEVKEFRIMEPPH